MSPKLSPTKNIALVAHDAQKDDLLEWVQKNKAELKNHKLFATGTTGKLLCKKTGLKIQTFKSGPLGGDQQIGAKIVEGDITILIFFWDPLEPQPHDPDVKALLRLAVLYNIPIANNLASADFLISSPYFSGSYKQFLPDFLEILKEIRQKDDD